MIRHRMFTVVGLLITPLVVLWATQPFLDSYTALERCLAYPQ